MVGTAVYNLIKKDKFFRIIETIRKNLILQILKK